MNEETNEGNITPDKQEKDVLDLYKNLSENDKKKFLLYIHSEASFSGPLPPPEILRQYNDVMPGLGERIVQMAENEQAHRFKMDDSSISVLRRGQSFAFLTVLLLIIAAIVCIFMGQWKVAAGIFSVTIIGTAAIFYKAQKSSKE